MYPKIRIDLNNDRLKALNGVWDLFDPEKYTHISSEEGKLTIEILNQVKEMLVKKAVSREFRDGDYFVKLKFYQAVKFYRYLDSWLKIFNPKHYPYEWNVVNYICNHIKQKLS